MLPLEVITLIASFLGGGLIAVVLDLWSTNRREQKQRKLEFIRLQLQDLYGPLQFFTSSNEQLFKLSGKFHEAYNVEYVNKSWSDAPLTQERLDKWTSETIAISNEYTKQVLENNNRILEILMNHYALIEPNDAEVFSQFLVDFTRHKTEVTETGLRTPMHIYPHIGEISFMRHEFIELVALRFKGKQKELEKLLDQSIFSEILDSFR